MAYNPIILTGDQIAMARGLARLNQTELARLATVTRGTISRAEREGDAYPEVSTTIMLWIVDALEGAGVEFIYSARMITIHQRNSAE